MTVSVVPPDALRICLLLGLLAHKGLWIVLDRRSRESRGPRPALTPAVRLVKVAKASVLAFLLAQTLFLDVLPISGASGPSRVVGIVLFALGLATAMSARMTLGRNWVDLEEARLVKGQSLVESGIYRFIRHPIYTGDLLLLMGLELALGSWLVLGVALPAAVVFRRARAEEELLGKRFAGYDAYRARTKRFIPFVA